MEVRGCLFLLILSTAPAIGQPPDDRDAELARKIKALSAQIKELSDKKQQLFEELQLLKEKRFSEQVAQQLKNETKKKLARVEIRGTLIYAPGLIYPGYPGYAYGPGYQGKVARYPDRYYLVSAEANWMLVLPTDPLRALAKKYYNAPVTVKGVVWQAKALMLDDEPRFSQPLSETIGVESLKLGWGDQ